MDHLGSPVAKTDLAGNVVWRERYTPYGELVDGNAGQDDLGFTGHVMDAATGLAYMQARYMDPVTGRFLSNDPVGFSADKPFMFNRYSYTFNDPVNMVDPDGEFGVLGALVGAAAEGLAIYSDSKGGKKVSLGEGVARVAGSAALGALGGGVAGRVVGAIAGAGAKAIAKKAAVNATVAGASNGANTAVRAQIQVVANGETDITHGDIAKDVAVGAVAAIGGQFLAEAGEFVAKNAGLIEHSDDLAAGGTAIARTLTQGVEGAANCRRRQCSVFLSRRKREVRMMWKAFFTAIIFAVLVAASIFLLKGLSQGGLFSSSDLVEIGVMSGAVFIGMFVLVSRRGK